MRGRRRSEVLRAAPFARTPSPARTVVPFALAFALLGCGGARPATREAAAARPSPPADISASSRAPPAPSPRRTLRRSDIHSLATQGLGIFLQRVELDDRPVRIGGKFHGFRIVALRDPAFWNGVDLQPGDVVTSVNGFSIERPEQAQTALDSLEVASELRVAYEREGQARELVFTIVDER